MTKYKIWLDDVRPMPEDYDIHFRHAESLIDYLETNIHKVFGISFDHDLGDELKTGYDAICYIEERMFYDPSIDIATMHVHSDNGPGRKNIQAAITSIYTRILERSNKACSRDSGRKVQSMRSPS